MYFTATDDNSNSNVLSTQKWWASWLFQKGLNNIILPINFRLMKHELFTKHIIWLWFKQLHVQNAVSESPFSHKTFQTLKDSLFYGLTSLIFNKTSFIWQAVGVCKCECPGKLCSVNKVSLTTRRSCSRLLQWCIKQDDDLMLRTGSSGKLLCLSIFTELFY